MFHNKKEARAFIQYQQHQMVKKLLERKRIITLNHNAALTKSYHVHKPQKLLSKRLVFTQNKELMLEMIIAIKQIS